MKKLLIMLMFVFSLVACNQDENVQENIEETIYESPYARDSSFLIPLINEVYFDYNDVFAGVYLVDGLYHLNITDEAPNTLISKLENSGLVTHHIVSHSYGKLWTVKEIVTSYVGNIEGISSIGISEKDNTVSLTLITDTVIPTAFYHYIEIGILTIDFQDDYATFN